MYWFHAFIVRVSIECEAWMKCLNWSVCAMCIVLQPQVYKLRKTATFYISSYFKFFLMMTPDQKNPACILWNCLYLFHSLLLYSDFSLQLSNSIYAFKKVSIEVFAPLLTSSNKIGLWCHPRAGQLLHLILSIYVRSMVVHVVKLERIRGSYYQLLFNKHLQ